MTILLWFSVVSVVFCMGFVAGALWHSLPWED